MALDNLNASIPLQFGNTPNAFGPDMAKILQMQQLQQRMAQIQQIQQGENALRALYADPQNVDAETNTLKPGAVNQLMRISPSAGQQYMGHAAQIQERQQRTNYLKSQSYEKEQAAAHEIGSGANAYYNDLLPKVGPKLAIQQTNEWYVQKLDEARKSGALSPQSLEKMPRSYDDPIRFRALEAAYNAAHAKPLTQKEQIDIGFKGAELKGQEDTRAETAQHHRITEDISRNKSAGGGDLSPDVLKTMGEQYLAGDKSVMQNIGRGVQGAKNIVLLRGEIARQAAEAGMSGRDIAAKMAEFAGLTAGERTLGTRTANIEMAVNEAQKLIPLALDASKNVNRTEYPTLNSLLLAVEKGTGSEEVVRLGIATNSLINVYARAISPTGVPTVSDKDHARELLGAAWSKGQYAAGVDQLNKELEAARTSPGNVREEFRGAVSRKPGAQSDAEPGAPNASGQFARPGGAGQLKSNTDGTYDDVTAEQYDALPSKALWRKPGDPPGRYRTKP